LATDTGEIVQSLVGFYDFDGKRVLHVGVGGGHILGYAALAWHVWAMDSDPSAVKRMRRSVVAAGVDDRFDITCGDFLVSKSIGDVTFLEFCLHAMADPDAALVHGRALTPEVLVLDHAPESQWAYITSRTERIEAGWAAVRTLPVRRSASFRGFQLFRDYDELVESVRVRGEENLGRAAAYRQKRDIVIRMPYCIALI
jgi:hypothetical protein